MLDISAVLPLLDSPKKIFITTHHKPDGDALGSSLALYHYFLQKGHSPYVVSPSEIPEFLQWMPGIGEVLNFQSEPKQVQKILAECDLIFCLDFNRLSRVKHLESVLREATQPRVLIDHHIGPEEEMFAYGISMPQKSSTCEMIYDFILLDGGHELLNEAIMQCIYTGLMTDTGSFRYPSTTGSVHEIIADFKRLGFSHSLVHEEIYDSWTEDRMRFLGYVLYEKMEIFKEQKTGIIAISQTDLSRFNSASGDTEGMVNYPLNIIGIERSILIIERNDEVKLSFRSKGDIDVSKFANKYFNGGGHFNAAGGQSTESLENVKIRIKDLLNLK